MRKLLSRAFLTGSVALLAWGGPAAAQSTSDPDAGSTSNQADNQTTSRDERQNPGGASQSDAQDDSSGEIISQNEANPGGRSASSRTAANPQSTNDGSSQNSEQNRREARQSRRQERQEQGTAFSQRGSNRDPAIGVTVVERGGMGVRVTRVNPQSPAAQAGIRPGDTIIEVDGRRVSSPQALVAAIQNSEVGETAEFAVLRDGREQSLQVRLVSRDQALTQEQRNQSQQFSRYGQQGQPSQDWAQDPGGWDPQRPQYGQSGQFRQSEQYGQSNQYRQGQWRDDRQEPWDQPAAPGRYAARGQFDQQQGWQQSQQAQYGNTQDGQSPYSQRATYNQDPRGWEQNRQASGYRDQYDANQQSYYDASQGRPQPDRRWSIGGQDGQFGERLNERIERLEDRFERLTQTLQRLEQQLSDNSSDASRESYDRSQDEARQANRQTDDGRQ